MGNNISNFQNFHNYLPLEINQPSKKLDPVSANKFPLTINKFNKDHTLSKCNYSI